jgi:hypothetical protein
MSFGAIQNSIPMMPSGFPVPLVPFEQHVRRQVSFEPESPRLSHAIDLDNTEFRGQSPAPFTAPTPLLLSNISMPLSIQNHTHSRILSSYHHTHTFDMKGAGDHLGTITLPNFQPVLSDFVSSEPISASTSTMTRCEHILRVSLS